MFLRFNDLKRLGKAGGLFLKGKTYEAGYACRETVFEKYMTNGRLAKALGLSFLVKAQDKGVVFIG